MNFLIRFIVTAIALYLIAIYVPGFQIAGPVYAIVAAIIFGLVNAIIGPVLRLLSLPFTIITLGLFSIIVNWALFALTVFFSPGFKTTGTPWPGWESTLVGAIIMMIVSTIMHSVTGRQARA